MSPWPKRSHYPNLQSRCLGLLVIGGGLSIGCTTPWTAEPPSEMQKKGNAVREILTADDHPHLIHEVAMPVGLNPRVFESFGLVSGLAGTGGDCRPSPQRDYLINEMRTRDVNDPSGVMASPSTAMVQIYAQAPAGARENQRIDALVKISRECDATSLQNGYLLEARLQEIQVLGGAARRGAEKARVHGPIVHLPKGFVTPGSTPKEQVEYRTGIILGGTKLLDGRMLGLHIRDNFAHVMTATAVSKAVNNQYFLYDGSKRRGVAIPKDDGFIQLDLPNRFTQDPQHFLDAILHIAFLEKANERQERLRQAEQLLSEPTTARRGALQLEALGREGIPALTRALASTDPEIRYYCAYSLAYLDQPEVVPILEDLAKSHPAFRKNCLIGLSIVDHYDGREALERLLEHPDPEVRYGAVDAILHRQDSASLLNMLPLSDIATLIEVPSSIPLVAVSLQDRPEIAIFGGSIPIYLPEYIEISPLLVMRPDSQAGQLRITKFQPNSEDHVQVVPADLRSALEGIQAVHGTYNDMVQFLDLVRERSIIQAPVVFNPRPNAGRTYFRDGSDSNSLGNPFSNEFNDEPQEVSQQPSDKPKQAAWYDVRRIWTNDR